MGKFPDSDLVYFKIRQTRKKNPLFKLLSYPLQYPLFTTANNSKVIGVFASVEIAKTQAALELMDFVFEFFNKPE